MNYIEIILAIILTIMLIAYLMDMTKITTIKDNISNVIPNKIKSNKVTSVLQNVGDMTRNISLKK